jgi:hypothetical protein
LKKRLTDIQERKIDFICLPEEMIPMPEMMADKVQGSWNLDALEVKNFHAQVRMKEDKRNVLTIIFDTASDFLNKDLDKAKVPGYDFINDGYADHVGHGHHVAGTIAAENTNLAVGYILAVDGFLHVMPVKIFHKDGYTTTPIAIEGYTTILDEVVDEYLESGWRIIINNSWGGGYKIDPKLDALFKKLHDRGCIIVSSSGNNGGGQVSQPANSKYSDAIGSVGPNLKRSYFSQYGEGLTVVAPGEGIRSTWPEDKEAVLQGTSMAAPHVAGVYALIASYWSDATVPELRQHFRKYTTDLDPSGYDIFTGFGLPVLGPLLNNEPGPVEDPGDDDPGDDIEDPIKGERVLDIPLDDLSIVWGVGSFQDQRPVRLSLSIDMTSDLLFETSYDELSYFSKKFFTNRGLYFSDPMTDLGDVGKWTIYFYELFAARQQFNINVKQIMVTDEQGRVLLVSGEGISPKSNENDEISAKASVVNGPICYDITKF